MNPLAARLAERIAETGGIGLAEFMAAALTDPKHGYYMGRDPFGAAGDFVTAPEVSQMFGELIGLWCAQTWQRLGAPDPVRLVELGPGRGTLFADALRAARVVPGFGAAARVHLVEVSPALRARQRAALGGLKDAPPATWHGSFDEVPAGPLLLIANEFFDALPVRQFQRTAAGWCERLVVLGAEPGAFDFGLGKLDPDAAELVPPELRHAAPGAIVEVCEPARALAAAIGRRLAAERGAALVIDYGHAKPGLGETVQAVRRHGSHPALADPGTVDLTAHVDFAALAHAAAGAGAAVFGPVPQGRFLRRLGIEARAAALLPAAPPQQRADIATALRRLTAPDQMGALFKALALADPALGTPAGFE